MIGTWLSLSKQQIAWWSSHFRATLPLIWVKQTYNLYACLLCGKYLLYYETPKNQGFYAHVQAVSTRPLLGGGGRSSLEREAKRCSEASHKINFIKCCTWWHSSHSAEVNENINLRYSQDQGTPNFRVRVCFRAILLCLILSLSVFELATKWVVKPCVIE